GREGAVTERADVGDEADREDVDEVEDAGRVGQADDVAGARAAHDQRLDRVLGPAIAEVAEEGVAGAEGEEAEARDVLVGAPARIARVEEAVQDLVAGSVAAHGDELALTGGVGRPGDLLGLAGRPGGRHLDLDAGVTEAL